MKTEKLQTGRPPTDPEKRGRMKRVKEYYRLKVQGFTRSEIMHKMGVGDKMISGYRRDAILKGKESAEDLIFLFDYMDDEQFYNVFFETIAPSQRCGYCGLAFDLGELKRTCSKCGETTPLDQYKIGNAGLSTYGSALVGKLIDRVIRGIQIDDNWLPRYYDIMSALNRALIQRYGNALKVDTIIDHVAVAEGFKYRPYKDEEKRFKTQHARGNVRKKEIYISDDKN